MPHRWYRGSREKLVAAIAIERDGDVAAAISET